MKHSFSYFAIIATILTTVGSTYAMETKKDKSKEHPINKKLTQPQIESQLKLSFDNNVFLSNEISNIKSLLESLDQSNKKNKKLEKKFLEAKTKYYKAKTRALKQNATDNLLELLKINSDHNEPIADYKIATTATVVKVLGKAIPRSHFTFQPYNYDSEDYSDSENYSAD